MVLVTAPLQPAANLLALKITLNSTICRALKNLNNAELILVINKHPLNVIYVPVLAVVPIQSETGVRTWELRWPPSTLVYQM